MPEAIGRWNWVCVITLRGKESLWGKAESISFPQDPQGSVRLAVYFLWWLSFSVP